MRKPTAKSSLLGLSRGLGLGLAGLRAGGALAADSLLQKARRQSAGESAFAQREAERFVTELGRLKGSYVKIGQMMALLGEHFLPAALLNALRNLHDATEPLPFKDLEPSLGRLLIRGELDIEREPLAAASLSQVHRARVKTAGDELVLKVQYPGLAATIDSDFDAVVSMLKMARWISASRELDVWLETLREQLHLEVNYEREAGATETMARHLESWQPAQCKLVIPRVYTEFSDTAVLALSFESGVSVDHPSLQRLSLERRNNMASAMLELFFKELYHWGVMQTDPNLGNYLVRPAHRGSAEEDALILLDFGSTVAFPERFLTALGATIAAGQRQNRSDLIRALIDLGCLKPSSHPEARETFADFCMQLLEPLRPPADLPPAYVNAKGQYDWARSDLMNRVARMAARSVKNKHFATPTKEFAVIARKLTGVFTFICLLRPQFNGFDIAERYVTEWLGSRDG